jgi:hypothetical protein
MPKSTRRTFLASTGLASATLASAAGPAIAGAGAAAQSAPPLSDRRILAGTWDERLIAAALKPAGQWAPFPQYANRSAWQALPSDLRQAIPRKAARGLGRAWNSLPATLALEYRRNGNRSHYEAEAFARRKRLRDLVLAECIEGQGRFLDEILNGVWLISEETWWGVPAHLNLQKAGPGLPDVEEPVVDLFAAETGSLMAWTWWLLGEPLGKLSRLAPRRMRVEIERRILAPCRERNDFWWMGLDADPAREVNNWNPWINSNWLTCALLMEKEERRAAVVHKILRSLDRFLDSYQDDGGCDEGPGYWNRAGASLLDCLELLRAATGGQIDVYGNPLVKEIGRYIYRVHIAGEWYINFSDAPAKVSLAAATTYVYGQRIGDPKLAAQGAFARALEDRDDVEESMGRDLRTLFMAEEMMHADSRPPLVGEAWLSGVQVLAARQQEGTILGLYLAAQGGHNGKSHNHNDVGNFIVYADGQPAIIDLGPETYSAKTFSARRYEIWTMRSAYHNCPLINGVEQEAGRRYTARDVAYRPTPSGPELRMDLAAAYPPPARVQKWERRWRLDRRKNTITVEDEWVLQGGGRIELVLMTAAEAVASPGRVAIGESIQVEHEPDWKAVIEPIDVTDEALRRSWGNRVWRVRLTQLEAPEHGRSILTISQHS